MQQLRKSQGGDPNLTAPYGVPLGTYYANI